MRYGAVKEFTCVPDRTIERTKEFDLYVVKRHPDKTWTVKRKKREKEIVRRRGVKRQTWEWERWRWRRLLSSGCQSEFHGESREKERVKVWRVGEVGNCNFIVKRKRKGRGGCNSKSGDQGKAGTAKTLNMSSSYFIVCTQQRILPHSSTVCVIDASSSYSRAPHCSFVYSLVSFFK